MHNTGRGVGKTAMGCCQTFSVFTEDELTTYQSLTNLNRAEIIHAYRKFQEIDPMAFEFSKMGRISIITVAETLPELAVNPFRYRICKIFCSSEQGFMDFDDFLDLVSVMSDHTYLADKLAWAFQIFDFNGDDALCNEDLDEMLDLLTSGRMKMKDKERIINNVLNEADSDGDGIMSYPEFERVITLNAAPDFMKHFRFIL